MSVTGKWDSLIENFEGCIIEWRTDSEHPGVSGKIPRRMVGIILYLWPFGKATLEQNRLASHISEAGVDYNIKYGKVEPGLSNWE